METQEVIADAEAAWIIESGYTTVQFTVKNLFFLTVQGRFAELTGSIERHEANLGDSSVVAIVKAASVDTGNRRRDEHLRSSDFLDVAKYPEIRFESKSVARGTDRDTLRIVGDLTIKATSREVVLDVTEIDRSRSPNGEEVAYYSAATRINRFDFGITYGRMFIGRDLKIKVHVQALRRPR
jgi:polyisoprenoid-binding protein YceI